MKDELTQENLQVVKNFFAAMGDGNKASLLKLAAKDIQWVVPGEDWALAGTHRGHVGLMDVFKKASQEIEMTYPAPQS